MTGKRLAVGVVLAVGLSAPAVAQANEVTKWNGIAQTTVLAQPPNASAPPAAGVFLAMVQGAVYGAVSAILGTDELSFFLTSSRFPMEQRHFERLSAPVDEVVEARIWAGIHFRNADTQGALVGQQVARYTRLHYFQPLH